VRDALRERGSFVTIEIGHKTAEELLRMSDDGTDPVLVLLAGLVGGDTWRNGDRNFGVEGPSYGLLNGVRPALEACAAALADDGQVFGEVYLWEPAREQEPAVIGNYEDLSPAGFEESRDPCGEVMDRVLDVESHLPTPVVPEVIEIAGLCPGRAFRRAHRFALRIW
jgi:hypothetical protein